MAYLASPRETKAIIDSYSFSFQKKFGQNFLVDSNVLENIIEKAGITEDDLVLEIGPGIGTMTQYLCESAREVVAIEIDETLIPILNYTLEDYDNVEIINDDALKTDIEKIVKKKNGGKPIKVVANLPYYITTPIIMGLLEGKAPIESITIMVQKEVAERMQTGPGSKDYGALSLAVQYYADANILMTVPASCFMPRPKVDSSVIKLDIYDKPPVDVCDEEMMFKIIRASFNQRRKTLVNGLKNASNLPFTKEEIEESIEKLGEDVRVRGEKLTLEQFAKLTNILMGEE
jgi:16S rRNA (adenine1518-N6/adenine1519-N6)-dimethyltransferase